MASRSKPRDPGGSAAAGQTTPERRETPGPGAEAPPEPEPEDPREAWLRVHRFHLRGPRPGEAPVSADLLPLLFDSFRDASRVRGDWPLFLPPANGGGQDRLAVALPEALREALDTAAPGEDGRVLRDNLPRAERLLRERTNGGSAPVAAPSLLEQAGEALRAELGLSEATDHKLAEQWKAMAAAFPADGHFLGYGELAPLHLLLQAARVRVSPRREAFRREVTDLAHRLRSLLDVETAKDHSNEPDALNRSVAPVGASHLDFTKLSKMVGSRRGTERMEPARLARVKNALAALEAALSVEPAPLVVLVHDGAADAAALQGEAGWSQTKAKDPCAGALTVFEQEAERWVDVLRAVRIARLEIDGRFDEAVHGPWAEAFSPTSFSPEELLLLPAVVALDSADRVAASGMLSLSRLLLSGKPVQALVTVHPARNPGASGDDPLSGQRLELGYLGIGHRKALVQQTSAARPDHLGEGLLRGLDAVQPALHVLAQPPAGEGSSLPPWLVAGAAVEGRAHPFFRYDPGAGSTWAGRMAFAGNAQPEEDWPEHAWLPRGEEDESKARPVAFGFADFALLDPALRAHFRAVPAACPAESLRPISEWIALDEEEALASVPYVEAVDGRGETHRLAVTRPLALATRERLDFWHTLQELAGIRNQYVQEAARRVREEAAAEAAAERDALEARHAEDLEAARREAAGAAMEALARRLLDMDLEAGPIAPVARPAAAPAPAGAAPEAPAEAPPTEAPTAPAVEEEVSEEPWIDTPLCTSCNDCTNINPLLFVYDGNKQAHIGDARAGTYAQLVQAAEKCPARCIHPGKPLDPSEPNLEELAKRAEPFL